MYFSVPNLRVFRALHTERGDVSPLLPMRSIVFSRCLREPRDWQLLLETWGFPQVVPGNRGVVHHVLVLAATLPPNAELNAEGRMKLGASPRPPEPGGLYAALAARV